MFCKNCGNDLRDDSQFCWNCGAKVEIKEEQKEEIKEEIKEPIVTEENPKKIQCKNCGNEIYEKADVCSHCGIRLRIVVIKNPGVAAVLSFFVPGLGYIYNGEIIIGIAFFIIEILLLGICISLLRSLQLRDGLIFLAVGFILWIYNIYSAHRVTEKINNRQYH